MKNILLSFGVVLLLILLIFSASSAEVPVSGMDNKQTASSETPSNTNEVTAQTEADMPMNDPLEPWNRLMFNFNDRLYFWVEKPVASVYGKVVPEWGRIRVRNVFYNIAMPIRFVNSLLQLKVKGAARELGHFVVNSTVGVAGMYDIKWDTKEPQKSDEDFGQTLGSYGVDDGFYIVWPVIGPSSLRDSIGRTGDYFLDPVSYVNPLIDSLEIRAYQITNDTSLKIGEYEDFKESAVDPYISMRDAYKQYRRNKIRE